MEYGSSNRLDREATSGPFLRPCRSAAQTGRQHKRGAPNFHKEDLSLAHAKKQRDIHRTECEHLVTRKVFLDGRSGGPVGELPAACAPYPKSIGPMNTEPSTVTALLVRLREGEETALDELVPTVYEELRKIAHNKLRGEPSDHTLRTTELVHEAYLKLVDHNAVDWQDRQHFFAVAARAMRQVLVDHARRRNAEKRGGKGDDVPLDRVIIPGAEDIESLVALNDALDRLAEKDERAVRVVECRFFGDYTIEETANILDVSTSTIERDWRAAQAWLNRELSSEGPPPNT